MADEEQLKILRQGVAAWNEWRKEHPKVHPDLHGADLHEADLEGAVLYRANLERANLGGANLGGALLIRAQLLGTDLRGANLDMAALGRACLIMADLDRAHLRGAHLEGADLRWAALRGADLEGAHLDGAHLDGALLEGAVLREARLEGAHLEGAVLERVQLLGTDLRGANLTGCRIYGASVWDIKVDERTKQQDLIITDRDRDEPAITVDNIKVAQFIYLLLNNQEIRNVIETITSKAVLILGRFSEERKPVLDALRDALRNKGFLPIVFDFERPKGCDFTETVKVLAGMSCFVIADITNPRSVPLELQATVPDFKIPFVPILQEGEPAFAMLSDLQTEHDWVLGTLMYDSSENLIEVLDDAVIELALAKRHELEIRKAQNTPPRHVSDYRKR